MNESGTDLPGAKKLHRNLFNSQYPIVSALMNQVSEETLAVAISKAGGFPSISGYCYTSAADIIKALDFFVKETGKSDLILGIDEKLLLDKHLVSKIKELKITHIFRYYNEDPLISIETKKNWRKITEKVLSELPCLKVSIKKDFKKIVDTEQIYFIKGNDGAGRPGVASTKELFDHHIKETQTACLVPSSGIGTADQVAYYLTAGAIAVGCGTLFAAATESILSKESKDALVNARKEQLSIVDSNLNQLGLVFSKPALDNLNNTEALKSGIRSATAGLIFAGHGVDSITSVDSVSAVINKLMGKIR
jgi:hypothetical protein